MADFLSNLAAKNLNLAPLLQPRPLAFFEPEQAVGARNSALQHMDALLEVSSEQVTAAPPPPPSELNSRIAFHADAVQPPRAYALDSSAADLHLSPRQTPEPPTREFATAQPAPSQHGEWGEEIERVSMPRVESAPTTETIRVERAVIEQEKKNATNTASTLDARAQTLPASIVTPLPTRPTVEHALTHAPRKDESRRAEDAIPNPLVTPLMPIAQSESEMPKLQSQSPQTPSAPPTIHVTIGRIEVRAALPNKPASRATRPTPTMSLEEYLRRNDKR